VEISLSETQPSHHSGHHGSAEEGIAEEGPPAGRRHSTRRMSKRKSAAGEEHEEHEAAGKLLEEYKEATQWMQSRQVRRQSVQSVVGTWNEGVSMGREVPTNSAQLVEQRRHSASATARNHGRKAADDGVDEETELEIRRRVREQLMQKHKKGAVEEAAASAQPVANADPDIQNRRRTSRAGLVGEPISMTSIESASGDTAPPVAHVASRRKSAFDYDAQMAFNLQATMQHRAESDASSDGLGELGVDDAGGAMAPMMTHHMSSAASGRRASKVGASAEAGPPRRHSMLEGGHQLAAVGSLMSKEGKEQRVEQDVAAIAMGLAAKLQAAQEANSRMGLTTHNHIHRRRQSA